LWKRKKERNVVNRKDERGKDYRFSRYREEARILSVVVSAIRLLLRGTESADGEWNVIWNVLKETTFAGSKNLLPPSGHET
jgi:hypothetical protein